MIGTNLSKYGVTRPILGKGYSIVGYVYWRNVADYADCLPMHGRTVTFAEALTIIKTAYLER